MDFKFEFKRKQISKIPREKILEELEEYAKLNNFIDFRQDDFDKHSSISAYTVYREFGSWEKAMQYLAEHLQSKGITFNITTRRSSYSEQEMFDEMERIWIKLGHRPSRNEWTAINPKISYDSLYRRFGGWTNACLRFIEYKSGGTITAGDENSANEPIRESNPIIRHETANDLPKNELQTTRTIPLSVRIKVLSRDSFRCVFCGKSPATDIGTKLHIDHAVAFSKGGKSTLDNLQTLCEECNLGKSDRDINRP